MTSRPGPGHDRTAPAPPRPVRVPTPADLTAAWHSVRPRLAPTPLVATPLAPGTMLKLETTQPTGSFKVRGALAALTALPEGTAAVTASADNHGLGVAFAAGTTGRRAVVVVPRTASATKVAKLRRFGVELVAHGEDYDAAEAHALELAAGTGTQFVSAYNDPLVIAGQATIGRELQEQTSGPLTVVCPVGGGGLAAGLALYITAERYAAALTG